MYAISGKSPDSETTYWSGGEIFSVEPEDAVRFATEIDAESTIDVLRQAWGSITQNYTVTKLPREVDSSQE